MKKIKASPQPDVAMERDFPIGSRVCLKADLRRKHSDGSIAVATVRGYAFFENREWLVLDDNKGTQLNNPNTVCVITVRAQTTVLL